MNDNLHSSHFKYGVFPINMLLVSCTFNTLQGFTQEMSAHRMVNI